MRIPPKIGSSRAIPTSHSRNSSQRTPVGFLGAVIPYGQGAKAIRLAKEQIKKDPAHETREWSFSRQTRGRVDVAKTSLFARLRSSPNDARLQMTSRPSCKAVHQVILLENQRDTLGG